jgi:phage virion morphogenesis protein
MAGVTLDIDDREVREVLQDLQQAVSNLEPTFGDIGEYLLRSHDERFRAGIDPDNRRWREYAPLDPEYEARKTKNKDKILILEGDLSDGLHYKTSPHELLFGTNEPYGATHQFGREEDGIPKRPFLGVSEDDKNEILSIINRHLRDALE